MHQLVRDIFSSGTPAPAHRIGQAGGVAQNLFGGGFYGQGTMLAAGVSLLQVQLMARWVSPNMAQLYAALAADVSGEVLTAIGQVETPDLQHHEKQFLGCIHHERPLRLRWAPPLATCRVHHVSHSLSERSAALVTYRVHALTAARDAEHMRSRSLTPDSAASAT
jgi:hypothetical protein